MLLRRLLKPRLQPRVALWRQRAAVRIWSALGRLPWRTEVMPCVVGGVAAERLRPRGLPDDRDDILLLHGGGYCWGGLATHRELAARLAHAAQRPVTVIDYRRAPEHPYPGAVEDALAAYRELRRKKPGQPIAVVGDSAGGGLTLALCVRLQSRGEPLPDRLGLISPWADLTHGGATLQSLAAVDPMISPASLAQCADRYRGEHAATNPEISPLLADLSALPPTLIQVGSNEVLLADAERLRERLGAHCTLEVSPDLWHVWHLFASVLPEGRAAIERLGEFLNQ